MKIEASHALTTPSQQAPKTARKAEFERQLKAAKAAQSAMEKAGRSRADPLRSELGAGDHHGLPESFEERASRRAFAFSELGMLEAGRAFDQPGAGARMAGSDRASAPPADASAAPPAQLESAPAERLAAPSADAPAPKGPSASVLASSASEPAVLAGVVDVVVGGPQAEPPGAPEFDSQAEPARAEAPDVPEQPGGETGAAPEGPSLTLHAEGGLAQLIVRAVDPGDRESLHRRLRAALAEHGLGLGDLVLNGRSTEPAPSGVRHGHRSD